MKMKKFVIENRFHETTATFLAPADCKDASEAYQWLVYEGNDPERRKHFNRIIARTCPHQLVDGCYCGNMVRGKND